MVTRSPFSAWVDSIASDDGDSRTGAIASVTSNVSPATKRCASTVPFRCCAARSPRAGVRRGSAIAFPEQPVDRARRLAFAALGPAGFCLRRPGEDVEMQPAFGAFDKPLQEQRAGDRAGKGARRRI